MIQNSHITRHLLKLRIIALDPGLGQARPGYGTGVVILECGNDAPRWVCLHSELLENRTDRMTDSEIAWYTAVSISWIAATWSPLDLGVLETVEYQGAKRAQQTIRLSLLVGEVRHALTLAIGDRTCIVEPRRTQVMRHLGVPRADQAERFVRRLVKGVGPSEHEASAAAAGLVGFEMWRRLQVKATARKTKT